MVHAAPDGLSEEATRLHQGHISCNSLDLYVKLSRNLIMKKTILLLLLLIIIMIIIVKIIIEIIIKIIIINIY